MARNFTLNFPSTALGPSFSTTGPTYVNHGTTPFGRIGIAFDDSADEAACTGMFLMPSEYTGSGTLKCDISYYTASATSGDQTKTVPGTAGHPDILTFTMSAKDSVAAGDIVRLNVMRDTSEDGVSGDVYVASVSLYEET